MQERHCRINGEGVLQLLQRVSQVTAFAEQACPCPFDHVADWQTGLLLAASEGFPTRESASYSKTWSRPTSVDVDIERYGPFRAPADRVLTALPAGALDMSQIGVSFLVSGILKARGIGRLACPPKPRSPSRPVFQLTYASTRHAAVASAVH